MSRFRSLRRYWWLLLPAFAGALGFGWRIGAFERMKTALPGGPPAIEYPAAIDLGERTANELVTARFQLANRGGEELVVHQVKASCSCGKLEREIDGRTESVEVLRLSPGERADMIVHTTIRTYGAGTYKQTMSFLTNDPNQPEGRITFVFHTTSGGLRVYPTAVQFGRLILGQKARQIVEVLDHDQPPQTVTKVVSTAPERVVVRWIPAKTKERRGEATLLGQLEVLPNTSRPLLLDTSVQIEFENSKIQPFYLQVNGRVTPRIEVTPQSLVLPLASHNGPVYSANCVVRLPEERAWRLEVDSISPGLKVLLPDAPKGAVQVIRITWSPTSEDGRSEVQKTVRLRAKAGEESEAIQIPVTCERQ